MEFDAVIYGLTLVAAVGLAGLSKGGFAGVGIIATPLMALVMPPVLAASVMLPILLIQDAYSVVVYRRSVDWRNIAILLPGAVAGIVSAYLLVAHLSQPAVTLAIGCIAFVFALRSLLARSASSATPPAPAARAVAPGLFWGAVSGFTSMISHAGSPPFQIYVMPQKLHRDLFVGTSVVFFAAVNWIKVLPFLLLGQLTSESLWISAALAPVAIISTFVGVRLVRLLDTERFYTVAYVLLLLVGLKLGWDGLTGLL